MTPDDDRFVAILKTDWHAFQKDLAEAQRERDELRRLHEPPFGPSVSELLAQVMAQKVSAEAAGYARAVAVVRAQADLPSLVHFDRPSDFRKGVLSCLSALQAQLSERTDG